MYVNPFWVGVFVGILSSIIMFITLCYNAGKRKK